MIPPRYALAVHMEREGDGGWVITFPKPEEKEPLRTQRGAYWPPVDGPPVRPFKDEDGV